MAENVTENIEKNVTEDMSLKILKKQLMYQRVSCIFICILVVCILSVLPAVFRTLKIAQETLYSANTALNSANETMLQAQDTLADVSDLAINSQTQINVAMEKFTSIDFEGLNTAIGDLEAVVEPMSKLFGGRKK